jgi:hypothetical protein
MYYGKKLNTTEAPKEVNSTTAYSNKGVSCAVRREDQPRLQAV